jgi:hypothetical protein
MFCSYDSLLSLYNCLSCFCNCVCCFCNCLHCSYHCLHCFYNCFPCFCKKHTGFTNYMTASPACFPCFYKSLYCFRYCLSCILHHFLPFLQPGFIAKFITTDSFPIISFSYQTQHIKLSLLCRIYEGKFLVCK